MKILDCEETRALEERAVDYGASYSELMETAGQAVVCFLRNRFEVDGRQIVVLCGKGNNGGDGFVIAYRLWEWNAKVTLVLMDGLPQTEIARQMLARIRNTQVRTLSLADNEEALEPLLLEADFIIDAIYGIGFRGAVPEKMRQVFYTVNHSPAVVVAVDIPSGLSGDTGRIEGLHIQAHHTITFSTLKPVHVFEPGKSACGNVLVASVGIDEQLLWKQPCMLERTESSFWAPLFVPRKADTNKGSYGRLLSLCGQEGMAGAAVLSGKAAVRCGVGLMQIALPRSIYPIVAAQLAEPIYTVLDDTPESEDALWQALEQASACLVGCGLGQGSLARQRVYRMVEKSKVPVVLDADGINAVAENIDIVKTAKAPVILTPHPGEMARLLGITVEEVQENRLEVARSFVQQYPVILVLKGNQTLIAWPGKPAAQGGTFTGKIYCNPTGNAGMAKGGSGDVLAGMIASLCAQGVSPETAAVSGVYLHGMAGDRCARRLSQRAMLPSDLVEELPALFAEFER